MPSKPLLPVAPTATPRAGGQHGYRGIRGRAVEAFSLTEVLFATAIFAVGFAGLYTGSAQVIFLLGAQRETHSANLCIQERVEQIRSATYSQITDPNYVRNTLMATATTSSSGLSPTIETIAVSAYPPTGGSSLQVTRQGSGVTLDSNNSTLASGAAVRVDFSLTWNARQRGRSRNRQIILILAKGGIDQ